MSLYKIPFHFFLLCSFNREFSNDLYELLITENCFLSVARYKKSCGVGHPTEFLCFRLTECKIFSSFETWKIEKIIKIVAIQSSRLSVDLSFESFAVLY